MSVLFHTVIFDPLLNLLFFLYNTVAFEDLGLAIIFLTILVRIVLYPVFHKSVRHQRIMQEIQPKLKKIQDQHKNDKTKQAEAMMSLYKDHKVNPFSGFLLLLVQLPILIALYQILRNIGPEILTGLYSFIPAPEVINAHLLGLINLSERNILIVVLAALAQYFQGKLSLPKQPKGYTPGQAEKIGKKMVYLGPVLTLVIFFNFPAAVTLYWLVTSIFSIGQQLLVNKQFENAKLGNIYKEDDRSHGVQGLPGGN